MKLEIAVIFPSNIDQSLPNWGPSAPAIGHECLMAPGLGTTDIDNHQHIGLIMDPPKVSDWISFRIALVPLNVSLIGGLQWTKESSGRYFQRANQEQFCLRLLWASQFYRDARSSAEVPTILTGKSLRAFTNLMARYDLWQTQGCLVIAAKMSWASLFQMPLARLLKYPKTNSLGE